MPKLRTNPSLTGGQIRLRSSGRASELKWLSVLAVLVAATAIEGGLPVADFGRSVVEFASRGGSTMAVASPADVVDRGNIRQASLATEGISNTEASDFVARYSVAAAGLMKTASLKPAFCPWVKLRLNT